MLSSAIINFLTSKGVTSLMGGPSATWNKLKIFQVTLNGVLTRFKKNFDAKGILKCRPKKKQFSQFFAKIRKLFAKMIVWTLVAMVIDCNSLEKQKKCNFTKIVSILNGTFFCLTKITAQTRSSACGTPRAVWKKNAIQVSLVICGRYFLLILDRELRNRV